MTGGAGQASVTGGSTLKGTSGVLRDLLSSVAQQVESHLYPSSPSSTSLARPESRVGRRQSRIRSWIVHDKDKNRDKDGAGSNRSSLRFTDSSDDEFQFVDDISTKSDTNAANNNNSKNEKNTAIPDPGSENRHHDSRAKGLIHTPPRHTHTTHDVGNLDTTTAVAAAVAAMHLTPDKIREEETVDILIGLMGEGFDREVAQRILRKYDGNVDKAAGALLEGERGEELVACASGPGPIQVQSQSQIQIQVQGQGQGGAVPATAGPSGWSLPPGHVPPAQTAHTQLDAPPGAALGGRPNTPVIDLTLDDDPDLQRAMHESMSTLHAVTPSQIQVPSYSTQAQSLSQVSAPSQGLSSQMQMQAQAQPERAVFGPSERAPDPSWALVPSNQQENHEAQYLQSLNRAIEASWETMGDSDALEPFPVEQQLRRDGCPVVLRPSMHTMVYAASIIQGLFYVPQVRQRMASWRPPMPTSEEEVAPPMSGPDFTLWALSEIFTHMDLARLCDLNVDKRLPAFNIEPWDRPAQPPGELSRRFFARLSATLEKAFIEQFALSGQPLPKPRLLHFQYGSGISEPGELLQETSIVPINVSGGESNDLIGQLFAQLSKSQLEPGKQSVTFEPSEVVAFELVRSSPNATASGGSDRKPFTYPKSIYLDQFLRENIELAQAKRGQRQEMLKEVQQLVSHMHTLTQFDGRDTLKDLRSTIFYFENVADAKNDLERSSSIQATTRKLKSILTTIEDQIKTTDEKIATLHAQAETLLECEELQQYKYDLRVVFVHDGLYGRKHLYSYVHDKSCWWKIADSLIEKVSEDVVLNDQAGLHLGAGPYLLFYSRVMDGSTPILPWMDDIKDDVKAANREFLSQLPPELVGDIIIDEEDIPPPGLAPGLVAVKKGGVGDGMDVS